MCIGSLQEFLPLFCCCLWCCVVDGDDDDDNSKDNNNNIDNQQHGVDDVTKYIVVTLRQAVSV